MKQYAALCCYFGQWPNYFQFWLKSCSYNTAIDFFLVSDISVEGYEVPVNVHIVKKSFAEVQDLVKSKFPEITVSVDRPYKLCDYKTAYGSIFSDLFAGYAYWGFFDIDTIWGNILEFIPENRDCHLVKILPCGHLSFVRNIAPYNKIFQLVNTVSGTPCRNNMQGKCVSTWQQCFSSPDSHYYDEEGGLEPYLSQHPNIPTFSSVIFDNILPPWRFDHFLSINFPEKSHFLVYSYSEGMLCRHFLQGLSVQTEEIGYLHVSKRRFSVGTTDTNQFVIFPNCFSAYRTWSLCDLLLHGRPRYLSHLLRRIVNKLQR